MKKILLVLFTSLLISTNAFAIFADRVDVIDSAFDNNFNSSNCDTVQECLETIDEFDLSGSSGGDTTWGSITGTLSNQTDLQSELDALVPYTGATSDVNLGANSFLTSGDNKGFFAYNNYSDGSNYELAEMKWAGNIFYIDTQKAGSGTDRSMVLRTGTGATIYQDSDTILFRDSAYNERARIDSNGLLVSNVGASIGSTFAAETPTDGQLMVSEIKGKNVTVADPTTDGTGTDLNFTSGTLTVTSTNDEAGGAYGYFSSGEITEVLMDYSLRSGSFFGRAGDIIVSDPTDYSSVISGSTSLYAGSIESGANYAIGASVVATGGSWISSYDGGILSLSAGIGTNTNGRWVAVQGDYLYNFAAPDYEGILDFSDIASSNKTFTLPNVTGTVALGTGTSNEIAYWSGANTLAALDVATYPSLTELSYLKGVTSSVQTALDGKVDENSAITGATKTKITYDAKGLVTAGADATTADISDSTNKRYVTDSYLTVLGNTTGTNTGDQSAGDFDHNDLANKQGGSSGEYYHLTSAQHTAVNATVTGSNAVDINSGTIDGATIGSATAADATFTAITVNNDITVGGLVDGKDIATNAAMLNETETISSDWVNTANPWADNEVADNLTISGGTINNTTIGASTAADATFNTATASVAFIGNLTGNSSTVTVADASGDTTTFPLLGTDATGSLSPRTDAGLSYNANTNALTATTFSGALSGNATTATALANNGGNCSAGNYPLGVDTLGAVESCTAAAPTGVNYLVGTANGTLSAEIAVGTTPGGELGGSWASPTIDDSVTVASWVHTLIDINSGTIDNTTIGATTPADATFNTAKVTDLAYSSIWDSSTSVPTRNAVYDKIETLAPVDATFVTNTASSTLSNEQALSTLATGVVTVTTSTGTLNSYATTAFAPVFGGPTTGTIQSGSLGNAGNVLKSNGAGAVATFGKIDLSNSASVEGVLGLANGGLGVAIADPDADVILFWDDSATSLNGLLPGIGVDINDNSLDVGGLTTDEFTDDGVAQWDNDAGYVTSAPPADADYLVGTANGGLSGEIVVGTSPGGELGGSWASPTIDDSLTVDAWTLTNVDINSGTIDGTRIGASSESDATFTDVKVNQTLTVGVTTGTGTSSSLTWYPAQGDYSTGTVAVSNGSATVTGSSTAFTSSMIGHYITIAGTSTIHRITNSTSGTNLSIEPVFRGTAGSGKAYTIYGGSVLFDAKQHAGVKLNNISLTANRKVAIGSRATLGGQFGMSALHVAEEVSPKTSLPDSYAALEFDMYPKTGGSAGSMSAMIGRFKTDSQAFSGFLWYDAVFRSEIDMNLSSLTADLYGRMNYLANGDFGSNASAAYEGAFGFYKSAYTVSGGSTVNTTYGVYLETETVGSVANYQIYSDGGDWYTGADNSDIYWGTGFDTKMYYDGTNFVVVSNEVGTGYTRFPGGIDATRIGASSATDATFTAVKVTNMSGTYGSGSAYACVNDAGQLFASDTACA